MRSHLTRRLRSTARASARQGVRASSRLHRKGRAGSGEVDKVRSSPQADRAAWVSRSRYLADALDFSGRPYFDPRIFCLSRFPLEALFGPRAFGGPALLRKMPERSATAPSRMRPHRKPIFQRACAWAHAGCGAFLTRPEETSVRGRRAAEKAEARYAMQRRPVSSPVSRSATCRPDRRGCSLRA